MSRVLLRRLVKLEHYIEDSRPAEPGFVLIPRALQGTPQHDTEVKAFLALHKGAPTVVIKIVSGRRDGSMTAVGAPVTT